jgi:hypothetical protein
MLRVPEAECGSGIVKGDICKIKNIKKTSDEPFHVENVSTRLEAHCTAGAMARVTQSTYSLEALQSGCPEGVDPRNKEMFLDDAKFLELFGCDKAKFGTMPAWKKSSQKKKYGILS